MRLPPAFMKFARNCVDISRDGSWTPRQVVQLAIDNISVNDMRGARDFINELTSGSYSREDLDKIWHSTGARVWYVNGYPEFLRLAKSMLDEALAKAA